MLWSTKSPRIPENMDRNGRLSTSWIDTHTSKSYLWAAIVKASNSIFKIWLHKTILLLSCQPHAAGGSCEYVWVCVSVRDK